MRGCKHHQVTIQPTFSELTVLFQVPLCNFAVGRTSRLFHHPCCVADPGGVPQQHRRHVPTDMEPDRSSRLFDSSEVSCHHSDCLGSDCSAIFDHRRAAARDCDLPKHAYIRAQATCSRLNAFVSLLWPCDHGRGNKGRSPRS